MRLKTIIFTLFFTFQTMLNASQNQELHLSKPYEQAMTSFENKNYKISLKLFNDLLIKYPDDENLNFYYGRSAFELKQYEFAFAAFDRVLIQNPLNHRARLEYARTLFMLEAYDEAKKEFEKILASPIPHNVRKNIEAFTKQIKSAKQNYILNSMAIIGFGWNDNLNNNTYENITMLNNLTVTNDTTKEKDYDFKFILFNNLIVPLKKNKKFAWESSAITYMQEQKEHHENDIFLISLSSGLSYFGNNYKNLTSLTYDHIWIGGDQKIYIYGFANNTKYKPLEQHLLNFDLKYKEKKMIESIDRDKDSSMKEIGLGYTYFLDNQKDSITFSNYNIFERKKSGNRTDISSDTNRYKMLYTKILPYKLSLDLSYLYEKKYFKVKFSGLPLRKDSKKSYTLKLTKQIDETQAIFGEFINSKVNSNINTYKYKKNVFSLNYMIAF